MCRVCGCFAVRVKASTDGLQAYGFTGLIHAEGCRGVEWSADRGFIPPQADALAATEVRTWESAGSGSEAAGGRSRVTTCRAEFGTRSHYTAFRLAWDAGFSGAVSISARPGGVSETRQMDQYYTWISVLVPLSPLQY